MIRRNLANDRVLELQKLYQSREKLKRLINEDFLSQEWPEFKVTNEMKENNVNRLGLEPRQRLGMYRTEEETKKYIEESLNTPLPGDPDWNKYQKKKQKAKNFGLRLIKSRVVLWKEKVTQKLINGFLLVQ